jgi:hypothetical protein
MTKFDKIDNPLKVVVIDICNESGPQTVCFDIDFSEYQTIDVYPNMKKEMFSEYECWCLRNVLSRPMHTADSPYWLNPASAGVNTCIKVHNMKASALKRYCGIPGGNKNFNESLSMDAILKEIDKNAVKYAAELAKSSVDNDVTNILSSLSI